MKFLDAMMLSETCTISYLPEALPIEKSTRSVLPMFIISALPEQSCVPEAPRALRYHQQTTLSHISSEIRLDSGEHF